jgi:transposase
MRGLTLTTREQTRLQILNEVLERRWSVGEATQILGVSERHTWRLLAAYRKEGAAALAHGNRDRRPPNATSATLQAHVVAVARERYEGVNHTHVAELLTEREGVVLSRSTIRRLLVSAGLPSPRHRRLPRHRCRRERMPQEGMLVQVDGSHHRWLEERGPWFTLLLAVDDATGTVPYALFQEQEDTEGYFRLLSGIVQRRGIPLALYSDRHTVFCHPSPANETAAVPLADQGKPTQFGRAMRELGIRQIFARSPEAKGRVERANGTFQDRLVSELRLAGVSTIAEANSILEGFLPRFNARFGVPAAQPGSAYRPLAAGHEAGAVLCMKELRRVAKDNTVQYHGRTLQLYPDLDRPSYAGARVEIQERLDGRLLVSYRGKILTPGDAPPLATALRASAASPVVPADVWPPEEESRRAARPKPPPGPLAGDLIWYEDPGRKLVHRDLVRAGMERARKQGKPIGRPKVTARQGFAEEFATVLERLDQGVISRRKAAHELAIGYATLKRLLDAPLGTGRSPVPRGATTCPPEVEAIKLP